MNTFIDSDTVSFPDGFYTGSKVNEIYNEGVLHGDNGFKGATVTYHLVHQHIDGEGNIHGSDTAHVETAGGCFTKAGTYQNYEIVGYNTRKVHHPGTGKISYYDCSYLPGHDKCAMDDSWDETVYDPVYGYKSYPCFYPDCGHAFHESEGTTTDYDSITATQEIQSISIEMF